MAGTGVAQVIVIATSPILTRLYSPADFGAYSVAVSILSLLLTAACLRYEVAIPLPESDVTAADTLALSLVAVVGTSALTLVVLILIGPWLVDRLGAPGLAGYVLLLPLAQLGAGVGNALSGWALRVQDFSAIAATRVTQGITLVAVQLGLGALTAGPPGLLVGDVIGRSSGSLRLARSAWRTVLRIFRQVSRAGLLAAATRYRRFPIVTTWSAFLATLGQQAPLLLVVAFYGTEAGGEYGLAARIGALPLALIAASVSHVFVAEAARLTRTQPVGLRRLFGRTTRGLAAAALIPALAAMVLAPLLAAPLFGSPWAPVGIFIAILAPSFYLEFVIGATGDVLFVLERQGLHLVREILRFVLIGGAIPLASLFGLPAVGAIAMLSIGRSMTYLAYGVVSWRAIVRHGRALDEARSAEARE